MKRTALIAASVVFVASGCASSRLAMTNDPAANLDTNRIAAINKVASERGVEVHWVNYPQRRPALVASGT